jgi:hypothetical protein
MNMVGHVFARTRSTQCVFAKMNNQILVDLLECDLQGVGLLKIDSGNVGLLKWICKVLLIC